MVPQNAAVQIRAALGCYNILLHKVPTPAKPKTVSYGANLKAHFDRNYKTCKRATLHELHVLKVEARKVISSKGAAAKA